MSSTNSFRSNKLNNLNSKHVSKAEKRKVRAITRIRPFFGKTCNDAPLESCVVPISWNEIAFRQQKYQEIVQQTFNFDAVYNIDSNQEEIFQNEVEPLTEHCLNGKNCTIFCYGPTGSGKTFTAFGKSDNVGIIPRAIGCALDLKTSKMDINSDKNNNYQCKIYISSLEIYNERIYDLLSKDTNLNKGGLKILQFGDNIIVKDLIKYELNTMEQFYESYKDSMSRRKTAFTALNGHSSRSHAIFTIYFEQSMIININNNNNNKMRTIKGKISIADLAGSENNKQTGNTGDRLRESGNINKSLLALGAVIDALNHGIRAPYRDSILTRLLSDCLGGNAISTMICCVTGEIKYSSMTRRCLEFGSNTRKIENKVIGHIHDIEDKENKKKIIKKKKRNNNIDNKRKYKSNTSSFNTSFINDTDSANNNKNDKNNNKKKQEIKYKIKPTPSKFIKNQIQIEIHEQMVGKQMMAKIDKLIKGHVKQIISGNTELKQESEEREMSVYENDKFGLPPSYTPGLANADLACDRIRKGRKYERQGKIKKALLEYERAKKLLKHHDKLQKKMDYLRLKLDENGMVKQLIFEDIPEETQLYQNNNNKKNNHNNNNNNNVNIDFIEKDINNDENEPKQKKQIKKKRKLRKKTTVEIVDSDDDINMNDNNNNNNNDDYDVSMDETELYGFEYDVNREKLLDVMNTSTKEQLKSLKTVGIQKAASIIQSRPFNTIKEMRKIKGFHTYKGWEKFIKGNEITFKQIKQI